MEAVEREHKRIRRRNFFVTHDDEASLHTIFIYFSACSIFILSRPSFFVLLPSYFYFGLFCHDFVQLPYTKFLEKGWKRKKWSYVKNR